MTRDKKKNLRYSLLVLLVCLASCGEQRFEAKTAENFTLPLLDGEGTLTLSDYAGDVIYLTFWASWCTPCQAEMPYLAQLAERHSEEDLHIIGINVEDDKAAAIEFASDLNINFPLVHDTDRSVSTLYRVPGYPTHYIVDRKGKIRYSGLGFNLADAGTIGQEVQILLQESVDATNQR